MLSNKYFLFLLLVSAVIFNSCGSNEDTEKIKPVVNYNDPAVVLSEAQKILGDGVRFAYKGYFLPDSSVQIAAGEEIENKDQWGIKFYLLKQNSSTRSLDKVYESPLFEGSFREAMIKKIKFPDFENELLYYNSQDYFLGSGGGEVFTYVINFEVQEVFYGHVFSGAGTGVNLFVSENTGDNLKNFFVSNFKRDFPELKIASRDIDLQ